MWQSIQSTLSIFSKFDGVDSKMFSIWQNETLPYLPFKFWWSSFQSFQILMEWFSIRQNQAWPYLIVKFWQSRFKKGFQSDKMRPCPTYFSNFDGVNLKRFSIRQNQAWPYLIVKFWQSRFKKVFNPTKWGPALPNFQILME